MTQSIEGQPAHRGRGVELLGDRDKGHTMGIEELDQLGEVGKRPRQPSSRIRSQHTYSSL